MRSTVLPEPSSNGRVVPCRHTNPIGRPGGVNVPRWLFGFAWLAAVWLAAPGQADAQRLDRPPWPTPVLLVVSPSGGQAGTTVQVTLSGLNLEKPERLLFSQPGLTASRVEPPKPPPTPGRKPSPTDARGGKASGAAGHPHIPRHHPGGHAAGDS